jgi:tetratricopeptide (TPR) repeat protein
MTQLTSSDSQWLQWIEVQKAATRTWLQGEGLTKAVAILDRYIDSVPPIDLHRQAIGFRGSLHEEQGNLKAAKADFLAARELSDQPDFERCSLEESIASVSAQLGDLGEAERWYWQAIETASIDPRVISGTTLLRFLEIRGTSGLVKEKQVIESILVQAWRLFESPGAPNLQNLHDAAHQLIEAKRRPNSAGT